MNRLRNEDATSDATVGVPRELRDPPPVSTSTLLAVRVGLILWLVLGILAVIFARQLVASGRSWMIGTPPAGLILGIWGYWYARRHPN